MRGVVLSVGEWEGGVSRVKGRGIMYGGRGRGWRNLVGSNLGEGF